MPMMFFYFLKIIFDISTSKRSKTYKPYSILVKKKNFKIFENAAAAVFPNMPLARETSYPSPLFLLPLLTKTLQIVLGFNLEFSQVELYFGFIKK